MEAYIGDMVFYQINTVIGESHPSTCIRRQSFINIAKSYDFFLSGPVGAVVDVTFSSDPGLLPYPISATTFKAKASNGTVFMPIANASITTVDQIVPMRAGDLLDNILLDVSGGQPSQKYTITQTAITSPLLYINVPNSGPESSLRIFVDGDEWARARLEADAQSTDEVYFMRTDEAERVYVFFGDGVNGKIPPNGAEIRFTCYLGTDKSSNVNSRTIRTILTPLPGLNSITNRFEASGGSARQSLQEGKTSLPASISTNNRAVNRFDFADLLKRNNAPIGVAKASASKGSFRQQLIWVVPNGGGPLTNTLRNAISLYLRELVILGRVANVKRAVDIPLVMELDVYIASNYRADDVIGRVRNVFITEVVNAVEKGTGIFDFVNLGLAGRDDTGAPQITKMRVDSELKRLQISGLQKVEIIQLRTNPVSTVPHSRLNAGNGALSSVQYVKPRDVPRREFRIKFLSSTTFSVYRRVVGQSTMLTDTQLVDDRLNLDALPEREGAPLGSLGSIKMRPDRDGSSEFPVDTSLSSGAVVEIVSGSAGSVFGSASVGMDYFLEFKESVTGVLSSATNGSATYASPFGDLSFTINSGTNAFGSGDELLFDVFPFSGDVLLRPGDHPLFVRALDGSAPDFVTNAKTNL